MTSTPGVGGTLHRVGTFDWHSDINDLDGVAGPDGLAAFGLYLRTGSWTSSNGRTGVVPDAVVLELGAGDQDSVDRLVRAGLWQRCDGGYRMLRGPHSEPAQPMPLWRYTDDDLDSRLFGPDPRPNT